MQIETATKFIPLGKAVLFLGAGFSSELTASDGEPVPSTSQLSKIFAERAGISPSLPLDLTSREFLRSASATRIDEYVNLMRSKCTVSKCEDWHTRLLVANWKSIYTTNYDDSVEFIESKNQIGLRTISPYSPFKFFDVDIPVVHLHGFIRDLNNTNYNDALLLTRDQYASYELKHKYWDFLQKDIERASAVFFCGFSLSDWHIERILSNRPDIEEKTFFILRPNSTDNEELKLRLREFGSIYFNGIEEFSKLVTSYIKKDKKLSEPNFLKNILEIKTLETTPSKAAEDVHFFGHHSIEMAELNRVSSEKILIERSIQKEIIGSLISGERLHLIHSEMGDGKTLIGEMIVAEMVNKGWKVLKLDDKQPDIDALIKHCRDSDENVLLAILENEISLRELVRISEATDQKNNRVLYCCRSAYFDLAYEERKIIEKSFQVWGIPGLSIAEFSSLNRIYERFGLWGDLQGKPLSMKQKYVLQDCNGEFRSLSIGHFHQERLTKILREEVGRIDSIDSSILNVLIIAMLYSYLGRPAKLYIINKFISKSAYHLSSREFFYGNFNIIYIENGEYAVPSSIFSREILKDIIGTNRISGVIEDMFVRSSEFGNSEFSGIRRELMQYGNLQRILVKPDGSPDLNAIVSLFRAFSDIGTERNNIHFWQQYSIALYIKGEYALSQKRLDTAKGLSRALSSYDTFMLDHHQARLLLVSRSKEPDSYEDHEDAFATAISIATSLISDPERVSERDTLYLSEHLRNAFSGRPLELVRGSTTLRNALDSLKQAVAARKPNPSVGAALLQRTLKDVQAALNAMT